MNTQGSDADHEPERVGSLKRGFNRIARDFDRALHLGRFSPLQLFLVQQARELSWTKAQQDGAPESYPFRLNLSEVARLAQADRKGVRHQHTKLFTARLFLDLGDGRHLINKDYRSWVDEKGRPLLSPAQLRWCLAVRRRSKGGESTPQGSGVPSPQGDGVPTPQADFAGVGSPHPRPVDSTPQGVGSAHPRPEESTPQAGKSGLGSAHPSLQASPQTPLYEARAHAGPGASAELRDPEEKEREPKESERRGGAESGEEIVQRLIREAKKHIHFLLDSDDSTYQAVDRSVRKWLRTPGVLDWMICDAFGRVAAKMKRKITPHGYLNWCDDVLREIVADESQKAQRWAEAPRLDQRHESSRPALSKYQSRRQALIDEWNTPEAPRQEEHDEPF